ncbi:MAG: 50S ribosomal protein L14 [Candidatus Absconditabacteria bacterium]
MLQNESLVRIVDNTGAKLGKVIRIIKGSRARFAYLGDKVVLAVKEATPGGQISKGDVVRGVIVRTKKEVGRNDGTYIRFEDNAAAIIDKQGNPKGKRIFGPVGKELRDKGFKALANLAEEVI